MLLILRVLPLNPPRLTPILILPLVEEGLLGGTGRCLSCQVHDVLEDFFLLRRELFSSIFERRCRRCDVHRVMLDMLNVRIHLLLLLLHLRFHFLEERVLADAI